VAVAGRFRGVVVCLLYWSLRRLFELVVLRRRSEREKEIEILLLRHQLRVLQRQVARPELMPADRIVLAALSRVLPRPVWRRSAFVTPATLLPLAPGACRPAVGVSASSSRSACDRRGGLRAGGAARAREPQLGVPADPG
jgi:hypothetical protein